MARVYPPVEREREFFDYAQRRSIRRANLAKQVTPDLAQRVFGVTRAYPWMRPGVVSALAAAGIDTNHPATSRAAALAARRAVRDGDFRVPGERRRVDLPPVGHWLRTIGAQAASTAHDIGREVAELPGELAEARSSAIEAGGRLYSSSSPEESTQAMGVVPTNPTRQVKALTRGLIALLDWGPQELSQQVLNVREHGLRGLQRGTPEVGAPSGLHYSLEAAREGRPIDLGTGYLPGGQIHEQRLQARETSQLGGLTPAQTAALNALPGDNAGTWASPGRLLARHVFEPGSGPFNTASGLADAAFTILADPTTLITPAKPAAQGSLLFARARGVPQVVGETVDEIPRTRAGLTRLFGGVRDVAPTTLDDEIEGALSSTAGRHTVDRLASTDSAIEIWELTRGKLGIGTTEALRATSDPAEVRRILSDRLRSGRNRTYPFAMPGELSSRVRHRTDRIRALQVLPAKVVDSQDLDDAADQIIRSGRGAKLSEEQIESSLREIGVLTSGDTNGLLRKVVIPHYADIFRSMTDHGSTVEEARRVAGRVFAGYGDDYRAYWVDAIGQHADRPGARTVITRGNRPVVQPSPHLVSELVNRAIPLPDAREVRRATAMPVVCNILRNRSGYPQLARWAVDAVGFIQSQVVNPFWLLRGAWVARVTGDLQARAAFQGLDSLASHPAAWLTWAVSSEPGRLGGWMPRAARTALAERGLVGRGEVGMNGRALRDLDGMRAQAAQHKDWFLGGSGRAHPADFDVERYLNDGSNDTRAAHDWADEILMYAKDPVMQASARLPERKMKNWYAGPGGGEFRERLALSSRGQPLTPEEVARYGVGTFDEAITANRAFIDDYAASHWRRIMERTNGQHEVIEAIAHGKVVDEGGTIDLTQLDDLASGEGRRFLSWMRERLPEGPDTFRGARFYDDSGAPTRQGEQANLFTDAAFEWMFTRPDQALNRSPHALQFYWQRAREQIPFMDEATRSEFLTSARNNRLGRAYIREAEDVIRRTPVDPSAPLTSVDLADEIARRYAMAEVKRLMYDTSRKHQWADMARIVAPFGEPLIEAITTWPRLLARNPRKLRRVQQVVSGAQGAGIFYNDPVSDELMFAYPSAMLADALGMPDNIEARFTGRAEGLQTAFPGMGGDRSEVFGLFGGLLPGVGPVVQIPAARWLPQMPDLPAVEEFLFPFGRPEPNAKLSEQLTQTTIPAWMRNFDTAFIKTPEGERAWDNAVAEILQANAASGRYSDPESGSLDVERMEADSLRSARWFFLLKGAAQFTLPTGGQIRFDAPDAEGRYHMVRGLGAELNRQRDELGFNEGTEAFLETFGEAGNRFFAAAQPKSVASERAALSVEGARWERRNAELVEAFPFTRAFFAPGERGELDLDAFMAQYGHNVRQVKTPEQYSRLLNDALGNMAYDGYRAQLIEAGTDPDSDEGEAWLREVNIALEEEYPGYGYDIETPGLPSKASLKQQMAELERAAVDDRLLNHPDETTSRTAVSLAQYLEARRMANEIAVEEFGDDGTVERRGVTSALGSKATIHLRDYLRDTAAALIKDNPAFEPLWERVLERELARDDFRSDDLE